MCFDGLPCYVGPKGLVIIYRVGGGDLGDVVPRLCDPLLEVVMQFYDPPPHDTCQQFLVLVPGLLSIFNLTKYYVF